jgi:addiction module HigA family antidote
MDSPASSLQRYLSMYKLERAQLSENTGIKSATIKGILEGRAKITPEIELRLSKCFKTEDLYWINLQIKNDISALKKDKEFAESLKQIVKVKMPKEPKIAAKTESPSSVKKEEPKQRERNKAVNEPESPTEVVKETKPRGRPSKQKELIPASTEIKETKPRGRPSKQKELIPASTEIKEIKPRGRPSKQEEPVPKAPTEVVKETKPRGRPSKQEEPVPENKSKVKKQERRNVIAESNDGKTEEQIEEPVKPRTILIKKRNITVEKQNVEEQQDLEEQHVEEQDINEQYTEEQDIEEENTEEQIVEEQLTE